MDYHVKGGGVAGSFKIIKGFSMSLTDTQLDTIDLAERLGGSFSLLGSALILATYFASAAFRKPVTRLIFYATFGNIFSAVASLIGRDGIRKGPDSPLCQVQAFFIQCWMPADSLWSFCMALNMYHTFYRRSTSEDLKSLEKWYFVICYGLPLILAIALCVIKTEERGRIYGPALIWCSITERWQFLRLVCFYGPVWVTTIATFAIYARIGVNIFNKYKEFQAANDSEPANNTIKSTRSVTVKVTANTEEASNVIKMHPYSAHVQHQAGTETSARKQINKAIWSYLRYSFLFFIAMVVTWFPSSINRIYSLAKPSGDGFGLNVAGALVLSLQGFWNSIIYASIAFPRLKRFWVSRAKSGSRSRSPWRTWGIRRRENSIPLDEMGFDERFNPGSTASLAVV